MAGEKTYYWDDVQFGDLVADNGPESATNGILIYPNPAGEVVSIEYPDVLLEPVSLSLYDANGKRAMEVKITNQTTLLSVDHLQVGVYYLRMNGKQTAYCEKLIIVR